MPVANLANIVIQHKNSHLGKDDLDMSATHRDVMKRHAPKCMCKSTRGRKMDILLSNRVYFRQFKTGAWAELRKVLGWACRNCDNAELHCRTASIYNTATKESQIEIKKNEGVVIRRGYAEDILYEDIGLVPDELKHLIPDGWTEGFGRLLPNPELAEHQTKGEADNE